MNRRTAIITFITLFFGLAFLAQPAIASECARMMRCMPGHSQGHLPLTNDSPPCDCTQSTQVLFRYACMPQNRSQNAPDKSISSRIDDWIPLQCDIQWLPQDWHHTEDLTSTSVVPSTHTPIFILNQSFLC